MGIKVDKNIPDVDFSIENIDNSKSGLVLREPNGSMVDFKTFSLDIRGDNPSYWYIKDIDGEPVNFSANRLYTKEGENVNMLELLKEADLKLFNNEIYDEYAKIRAVEHFMWALEDLEELNIDKDIDICVNTIEKKDDEFEIGYTVIKNSSNADGLRSINASVKIGDDKNYSEKEIEGEIFNNVLKNVQKSLENENVAIKTEADFIIKNGDYAGCYELDIQNVSAGEWFNKGGGRSGLRYFAVNDGTINAEYAGLSSYSNMEKSLAYHNGRMYYFDSPYLKELYDELGDKGFTKDEIEKKYDKSLGEIIEDSRPFDDVNDMLNEQGLADRLMVISRKGKDNFVFPKILDYSSYCDNCDYLLVETKPSKDELKQCLTILEDVKDGLLYSAKEQVFIDIQSEEDTKKQQYDEFRKEIYDEIKKEIYDEVKKEVLTELNLGTDSGNAEETKTASKIRKK